MTEDIFKIIMTTDEDGAESELVTEETLIQTVDLILSNKRNLKGFILEVEKVQ